MPDRDLAKLGNVGRSRPAKKVQSAPTKRRAAKTAGPAGKLTKKASTISATASTSAIRISRRRSRSVEAEFDSAMRLRFARRAEAQVVALLP